MEMISYPMQVHDAMGNMLTVKNESEEKLQREFGFYRKSLLQQRISTIGALKEGFNEFPKMLYRDNGEYALVLDKTEQDKWIGEGYKDLTSSGEVESTGRKRGRPPKIQESDD